MRICRIYKIGAAAAARRRVVDRVTTVIRKRPRDPTSMYTYLPTYLLAKKKTGEKTYSRRGREQRRRRRFTTTTILLLLDVCVRGYSVNAAREERETCWTARDLSSSSSSSFFARHLGEERRARLACLSLSFALAVPYR